MCNSLTVEDFLKTKELLYPNPFENILNLKLSENKNTVTVFDFSGKKLLEKNIKANTEIDMTSYHSGNYLIKIKNSMGTNSHQLIKK